MNWIEISNRYKEIGINLIEKTNEGTISTKNGIGQGQQDYSNMKRVHKVLLRMGFEFLIKSLYLSKGWNIYNFKIKPIIRFEQLANFNESNLDLGKTIDFKILIDKLNLILTDYSGLINLKNKLHKIRKEGNNAIHNDKIQEAEIDWINQIKEEIIKITEENLK